MRRFGPSRAGPSVRSHVAQRPGHLTCVPTAPERGWLVTNIYCTYIIDNNDNNTEEENNSFIFVP